MPPRQSALQFTGKPKVGNILFILFEINFIISYDNSPFTMKARNWKCQDVLTPVLIPLEGIHDSFYHFQWYSYNDNCLKSSSLPWSWMMKIRMGNWFRWKLKLLPTFFCFCLMDNIFQIPHSTSMLDVHAEGTCNLRRYVNFPWLSILSFPPPTREGAKWK